MLQMPLLGSVTHSLLRRIVAAVGLSLSIYYFIQYYALDKRVG